MDAARAILAGAVAFGHAWALLIEDYAGGYGLAVGALYYFSGFAHIAVVLFFVLSGFWITRSVARRMARGWSWGAYLRDRLTRLWIVVVPALALGGMLDWIALEFIRSATHDGLTGTWVLRKDVRADLSLVTLAGNLVFLQDILVHTFGSNGPLWSVAAEFWYYIWFPALWLALAGRKLSLWLVTLVIAMLSPIVAAGFVPWLIGSTVALADIRRGKAARKRASAARGATAALVIIVTLAATRILVLPGEDVLIALAGGALLHIALEMGPRFPPRLRPIARFGAGASFSLYAIHFPILAFAAALLLGDRRLPPDAMGVATVFAALGATIVIAWAFASLTEAQTGRVRRLLGGS